MKRGDHVFRTYKQRNKVFFLCIWSVNCNKLAMVDAFSCKNSKKWNEKHLQRQPKNKHPTDDTSWS